MKIHCYHGSGELFEEFDANRSAVKNDFFGGEIYLTNNETIAEQYAKSAYKKGRGNKKFVYECELEVNNLFDISKKYSGKELIKLLRGVDLEKFARTAGLLNYGTDKDTVISSLKKGNIELSGEQIFLGLSDNQRFTSRAREKLKNNGYDGLTYYGAKLFGTIPHQVFLPYNPNKVSILNIKPI